MDRGPRTGVTGAVSLSDLEFVEGGGPQGAGLASWRAGLLDGLADSASGNSTPLYPVYIYI